MGRFAIWAVGPVACRECSEIPKLVVIYLGLRVNRLMGLKTLIGFGPQIAKSAADRPDGLLSHENRIYSLFPTHVVIRQYWRITT